MITVLEFKNRIKILLCRKVDEAFMELKDKDEYLERELLASVRMEIILWFRHLTSVMKHD